MKTVVMSAHTLDLKYAQSSLCLLSRNGEKQQQNKMWGFFVRAEFELEYCLRKGSFGLCHKYFTLTSLVFFIHFIDKVYWAAMAVMEEHKAAC